jgi:hypothetical protein
MVALLENLCHYQNEGESFVENIVTGDKHGFMSSVESKQKLNDLETSSFTYYKKSSKLDHLKKNQWQHFSQTVKAS